MNKQLPEAEKVYESGYYSCPLCHDAVYHELSFTHRNFQCKDCNQVFLVPESIKLNTPKSFKKKRQVKQGA